MNANQNGKKSQRKISDLPPTKHGPQGGSLTYGGGGGTGKVTMQDFHFTMQMCTASPDL